MSLRGKVQDPWRHPIQESRKPSWHGLSGDAKAPKYLFPAFSNSQLAGKKRLRDDGFFSTARAKRRASAKVDFLPGTFRAVVIIDDGDDYPVIPRDRREKTWNDAMLVEDELLPTEAYSNNHGRGLGSAENYQCIVGAIAPEDSSACVTGPALATAAVMNREFADFPCARMETYNDDTDHPSSLEDSSQCELDDSNVGCLHPLAPPLKEDGWPSLSGNPSGSDHALPMMRQAGKYRRDKMSCEDRKRVFINNPPLRVSRCMKAWVEELHNQLNRSRSPDECWIHPTPPLPCRNGRPRGAVSMRFTWRDGRDKHMLWVNFGVAALLLKNLMTDVQKAGFIEKRWHLSHLCGNWLCLNTSHFTVEPGPVNVGRNCCFTHRNGCSHVPMCMKEKKRKPLTPVLASLYGLERPIPTKQTSFAGVEHHADGRYSEGVAETEGFTR
ncbi:MAG: hypothetical protein M1836_007758 [Candelina mexicana]|nr:MAG: hypothetical protein M1836_007758 [Candelina mexicana]